MKRLCEGLEVSQDRIAAGRAWMELGSGPGDHANGDGIGKRIRALFEELLHARAICA